MSEIVEGLGASERDRIAELITGERFFWVDISLSETSHDDLGEALRIPSGALEPLLDFRKDTAPSRKFHADGQHVVFTMSYFRESSPVADETSGQLRPIEVHILISGDCLLTVHEEAVSLPKLLTPQTPEGRSEQYVVYAILDAIVASSYDALNEAELTLEGLQLVSANLHASKVRMATLREINSRLSQMRRRLGPQRGIFERISVEIGRVEGLEADSQQYFERIYAQLNRVIDGIDATGDAMAKLIDLRLNETIYWLTVVATVFLPLTFVTGFFGMNFTWMVEQIDTPLAFVLLGIGTPALGVALTLLLVRRRGTPVEPDHNSAAIASSGSDVSIPA
jgi:magnesium transporter